MGKQYTLASRRLLVIRAKPCPCGWLNSGARECTCSPGVIERFRQRLSGPLLDRIDLHVYVRPVPLAELRRSEPGEPSAAIRERVERGSIDLSQVVQTEYRADNVAMPQCSSGVAAREAQWHTRSAASGRQRGASLRVGCREDASRSRQIVA